MRPLQEEYRELRNTHTRTGKNTHSLTHIYISRKKREHWEEEYKIDKYTQYLKIPYSIFTIINRLFQHIYT